MIKEEASGASIYKPCAEFVLPPGFQHQRQKASSKLAMLKRRRRLQIGGVTQTTNENEHHSR